MHCLQQTTQSFTASKEQNNHSKTGNAKEEQQLGECYTDSKNKMTSSNDGGMKTSINSSTNSIAQKTKQNTWSKVPTGDITT